jgi:hypothetical protein
MRSSSGRLAAALLPALLLLVAANAGAATVDTPRCQSARYRAVARHATAYVRCRVDAPGFPATQDCQNAAFAVFEAELMELDARRGCDLSPDRSEMGGQVYAFDNELTSLVGHPEQGSLCVLARWEAASRYTRLALLAHARNARGPNVSRFQRRMAKLASNLSTAFGRAEEEGDCGSATPEVAAVAEAVAVLVENVRPICGNDRKAFGESCDGTDSPDCPGLCQADCTCGPPVCGDGQVTGDEDCDGDVDDVCPGLCEADCRCPDDFCGNDVAEPGEECDGTDVAACSAAMAYPQCGAPGEADACTCSSIPVELDACPTPPSTDCPAGQSCVNLGLFLPAPTIVHGCVAPEPATCTGADQCTLAGSTCEDGSCCGTIGTACSAANPCCTSDSLRCGASTGGIATCCLDSLMPCVRDEDCCNFACTTDGSGARYCAFF